MSNSRKRRHERADHGIRPDERGQDQPTDKTRAQQVTHGEEAGAKGAAGLCGAAITVARTAGRRRVAAPLD